MTTISALPSPPSTSDPANFATEADAFIAALPTFVTQTNAVAGEVNAAKTAAETAQGLAETAATTATTQAGIATTKAGLTEADAIATAADRVQTGLDVIAAAGSASAAAAAALSASEDADAVAAELALIAGGPVVSVNGKTGIAVLTASDVGAAPTGAITSSGLTMATARLLGRTTASTGAIEEISVSGATLSGGVLTIASGTPAVTRSARTSNTILGTADKGYFIDITSGTFTQTFTAAATLGDGWWCYIRNSGTGDITLNPNSSEQIDGLTSYVMYPGETRLVQCTGTAFYSMVVTPFYKVISSSTNFIKPPHYQIFEGYLCGGGGSGGAGINSKSNQQYCRGGKNASSTRFWLPAAALSSSSSVVIGAGGVAVTVTTNNSSTAGNAGGTSTFASMSMTGGAGGAVSTTALSNVAANALGTYPFGQIDLEPHATGYAGTSSVSDNTITIPACGGPVDTFSNAYSGGTSSLYGAAGNGRGQDASGTLVGYSASGYGCGGGACVVRNADQAASSATSGAGGTGALIIWGVI